MNTESNKSLWSDVVPAIASYTFAVLVFMAIMLTSPAAWGETEKAEFSIHLFQNGLPIADAELLISSESFDKSTAKLIFEAIPATYTWKAGDAPLKTNANGSIAGKLPPGLYQFTIKAGTREFTFDLPLRSTENAQILVTFFPSKKKPLLNIESSVVGTVAGTDAASVANQGQGEGTITVQVVSAETGKSIKDVQVFLSGINNPVARPRGIAS